MNFIIDITQEMTSKCETDRQTGLKKAQKFSKII